MLIDYIYILVLHETASGDLIQETDQFHTHLAVEMLQPQAFQDHGVACHLIILFLIILNIYCYFILVGCFLLIPANKPISYYIRTP